MVDTIEATKDRELAKFILNQHQAKKTQIEQENPPIPQDFLKKYISYSNIHQAPDLTAEAAEVIENFYVGLRKSAEGGAAVPITARQLEALVRLSEARAKMALQTKVSKEDAQAAVRLMEESLRMVALDRTTGKIDIDMVMSKMSSSQRNISDTIIKEIKEMEAEGSSSVDRDTLIQKVVSTGGVDRSQVEKAIEKLLADGTLYSPREGKLRHSQN